jgi:hypothetical protein
VIPARIEVAAEVDPEVGAHHAAFDQLVERELHRVEHARPDRRGLDRRGVDVQVVRDELATCERAAILDDRAATADGARAREPTGPGDLEPAVDGEVARVLGGST